MKSVRCRFSHVSNQTPAGLTSHQSAKVCSFFLKGQCSNGDDCIFLHPRSADTSTNVAPRKVAPVPLTNGADGRAAGGAPETKICSSLTKVTVRPGLSASFFTTLRLPFRPIPNQLLVEQLVEQQKPEFAPSFSRVTVRPALSASFFTTPCLPCRPIPKQHRRMSSPNQMGLCESA
jgi:hypothetical protein